MSPLTPYLLWIKLGAAGLVIALAFDGGCRMQAARDAGKLAKKDQALEAAAVALRASGAALREINEEAERRIKLAEDVAQAAAQAGLLLADQHDRDVRNQAELAKQIEAAKRRRPACADLLKANLEVSCGFKPR